MSQEKNATPAPSAGRESIDGRKTPRKVRLRPVEVEVVVDQSHENWIYWKQAIETLAIVDRRWRAGQKGKGEGDEKTSPEEAGATR